MWYHLGEFLAPQAAETLLASSDCNVLCPSSAGHPLSSLTRQQRSATSKLAAKRMLDLILLHPILYYPFF